MLAAKNMGRIASIIMILLAGSGAGCSSPPLDGPDTVFIVHGATGNWGYGRIVDAVKRPGRSAQIFRWGAPAPLSFLNLTGKGIHDGAEKKLAARISQWRHMHPDGRIDLIGHSAGGGVVLGALSRLDDVRVNDVILLHPSVSPVYDLRPVLARIDGQLHSFHSEHDTALLSWRARHFGTYDRIRTPAAGHLGFQGDYPSGKLVQHPYDEAWRRLGHTGGHFTVLSRDFIEQVIAPLLGP